MARKDQSLTFDLTPRQRAQVDNLLKTGSAEKLLTDLIDDATPPEINAHFTNNKDSYAFWGPTTSELVKTPDSIYVPLSLDAFKVSAMHEHKFQSDACRKAYIELLMAVMQILQWCQKNNINEFFLKNANFSGKHRWPFTSNVNLNHTANGSDTAKIGKILNHVHNINEYSMLCWSSPGLGLLARKKLDLEPIFYAFGSTFYKITNPANGDSEMLQFSSARKNLDEYVAQKQRENPHFTFEKIHIGMPITKEIRIFSINGDIQGYVPYWTPIAFQNQSVYGMRNGTTLDDALRELATFSKSDIQHLHDQTNKIIQHPKFSDTDWAIDWVLTRDNEWYMIDMQTAQGSYMDVANMQFANANSQPIVYNFVNDQLQQMINAKRNMTPFDRFITMLVRRTLDIDKNMQRFGYPTQKELAKIRKQIGERTR